MDLDIYPSPEFRELLLAKVRPLGCITVSFNGGGDSGSIDDIYYGANAVPLGKEPTIPWPETVGGLSGSRNWIETTVLKERPLRDVLTDLTYMALDEQGLDWYNNEGGSGTLEIEFPEDGDPVIKLHTDIRVIEYESHEVEL